MAERGFPFDDPLPFPDSLNVLWGEIGHEKMPTSNINPARFHLLTHRHQIASARKPDSLNKETFSRISLSMARYSRL